MVEAYEYTDEELRKCGDAIVWTTIYAAVHNDGVVDESEKAEAIKQTHVRSFSTEAYLMPIYKHLDANFESLFDAYSSTLTGTLEEKEELIQAKISEALEILTQIGPLFTERFSKDIADLYNRVFHADSSLFQIFMLPVLTAHLNKFGKKD